MPSKNTKLKQSVRSVLREQTNDIHQLLHQHSSFVALFEHSLKIDEYQRLMKRLLGFYAPLDDAIETLIAQSHGTLATYDYVRRSDFLMQDLRDLGVDQRTIDTLPHCDHAFRLMTEDTLGGFLYVVEGATLGGSMIGRATIKILGADDAKGGSYWAWCRVEGKRCWSNLNVYLDRLDDGDLVMKNHLTGATDAFQIFADWLEPLNQTDLPALKIPA